MLRFSVVPLLFLLLSPLVQASLLISPQRLILDNRNPQGVISLHNPGNEELTYRLEWSERRVNAHGVLEPVAADQNPLSLARMVRFSPRRVTLKAGETQTIRLAFRAPPNLAPGEYRSHLRIRMESDESASDKTPQEGIGIQLRPLLSFTLPIFVRQGSGGSANSIAGLELTTIESDEGSEQALRVAIDRTGPFSSYGRLLIFQQKGVGAAVEQIGESGGVAIYSEVSRQIVTSRLKPGSKLDAGDWIRVIYQGDGEERDTILAERTFRIDK
jgi:fimbrial chaperone protein